MGASGQIYFGYDGSYRSDFSSNPSPSIYTTVDGYALSNFRVGFRSDSGFNLFAWTRNALDQDYYEQLQVPSGNTGLIVGNPGDPRTGGGDRWIPVLIDGARRATDVLGGAFRADIGLFDPCLVP